MKTIKNLINEYNFVLVYLANNEIGNKFMQQAEDEGFTFNDGAKPTSRCYAEIIAVNDDYTINFTEDQCLFHVDFEKYINGESDYLHFDKKILNNIFKFSDYPHDMKILDDAFKLAVSRFYEP